MKWITQHWPIVLAVAAVVAGMAVDPAKTAAAVWLLAMAVYAANVDRRALRRSSLPGGRQAMEGSERTDDDDTRTDSCR